MKLIKIVNYYKNVPYTCKNPLHILILDTDYTKENLLLAKLYLRNHRKYSFTGVYNLALRFGKANRKQFENKTHEITKEKPKMQERLRQVKSETVKMIKKILLSKMHNIWQAITPDIIF